MNPLHWTRQHQLAWFVISVIGAVLGLLLGFMHSPSFSTPQAGQGFVERLSFLESYWRWPLYSFLITGLTFYAVQMLRSSN